jgi:hypothetical protein
MLVNLPMMAPDTQEPVPPVTQVPPVPTRRLSSSSSRATPSPVVPTAASSRRSSLLLLRMLGMPLLHRRVPCTRPARIPHTLLPEPTTTGPMHLAVTPMLRAGLEPRRLPPSSPSTPRQPPLSPDTLRRPSTHLTLVKYRSSPPPTHSRTIPFMVEVRTRNTLEHHAPRVSL